MNFIHTAYQEAGKKMFGPMLDWILAAVLGVVTVVLLMGKGDSILKAVNGKRGRDKKKSDEDKKKYSRAMGIFTGVLALDEVVVALFPDNPWVIWGSILVAVGAIIGIGQFTKKFNGR